MRPDLMEILVCPICRGELTLTVATRADGQEGDEEDAEIIEGNLECQACPESYPIVDSIPNLLPPSLRE